MDDDYAASGSGPACPRGMIRRRAYTKKNKSRVKSACIKDRGAKGRWQTVNRSKGIGPLKSGELRAVGYYALDPAPLRHTAVDKAVKKYGRNSTIRKLNAIAVYTRRTNPSRSKTYKTDMSYVQKNYPASK